MPVTRLQFNTIKALVDEHIKETNYLPPQAFLSLVLENYLDLDQFEVEDSIVDGKSDCGIDAIYIEDVGGENRPIVYIFQSKYYQQEDKYDRNFEGSALEKMQSAIDNFIFRRRNDRPYQNTELIEKLNSVHNLVKRHPKYKIVFVSNSNRPTQDAIERFNDYIKEIDPNGDFSNVYLDLFELSKIFAKDQKKIIDRKIQFQGKYIDEVAGNIRMLIGVVSGINIAEIREQEGENLFDMNVRGYLSRRNSVNRKILETSTGADSPYFLYLNNGVTITCDEFGYSVSDKSPLVDIKNLQIVNGGQTTNSIFEAHQKGELKPDVYVLVRIIKILDKELLSKIILSTNSQSKVNSRDLRSNDRTQKLIEENLRTKGYYYEARKDKFKNKQPNDLRVDAEIAAQAYYAILKEKPAAAKNEKRELFGDLYDAIFSESILKTDDLLLSFILFKKVRALNSSYKDKYTFANDASLHTAALLYSLGIKKITDIDSKDFIKKYKNILEATKRVVDERIKEEGDSYSHRKTFIDPEMLGRIYENMISQ